MVPEAIRSTYVDMLKEPRCVQHVSLDRVCWPTLRFPPLGPPGRVPQLQRYYQSVTTSYRHLAALRFLRLAIPRMHSLFSLSGRRVHRQSLELVTRYLQPGFAEEQKKVGLSQVPGEPQLSVCHVPIRLRQDCLRQTIACSSVAPGMQKAKAPTKGLSELNSMAFGLAVYASWSELPQYHARLASSCWSGSTGRDFHPQGSAERFQSCNLQSTTTNTSATNVG